MSDPIPIRVLFVEDSETDVELALHALKHEGFSATWQRVDIEDDMRSVLKAALPEVILSDYSMPSFDGARALRIARELVPDVPFIFVSGTIGEERAIEAIRLGATDYVLKGNTRRLGTVIRRALTEVEERKRMRIAEAEHARLLEVIEATSDFVSIATPAGEMLYLNQAGRRLIGAHLQGTIDKRMEEMFSPSSVKAITHEARAKAEEVGTWHGEAAILSGDGTEVPVSVVMIAHRADDGGIRFLSTVARDIRERKAYEARIEHFANYDPLTGLPNRNLLGDRVAQALLQAQRGNGGVALLMLNVDRFKLVNDSYGHSFGDRLLSMVAMRLKEAVAAPDTVARIGSDSFAVLATGLRHENVWSFVHRIREAMEPPFLLETQQIHLSVGIGASAYPRDGDSFDILLRNADAALHRAKAAGQDMFQFYAATMTREVTERVELERELRLALEENALEMHFQPQISLATGRVVGVESLMRWHHPDRGPISPARFIPVAEDSKLIYPLGEFAINEAIRQIKSWDAAGLAPLRISVNVSAQQFHNRDFLDRLGGLLREADVELDRFEIELTESILVENQDEVIASLKRLKQIGVKVAIDDFGTGYSSLSYLSRLPIDCLKIDQSFIRRLTEHGHDAAIAQGIISLAHALGLRVIAEGVETEAQLEFLNKHHCDEGQGYLYCRPMPADKVPSVAAARLGP